MLVVKITLSNITQGVLLRTIEPSNLRVLYLSLNTFEVNIYNMKILQYWVITRLVALLLLISHVILLDFLLKVDGTDLFHFVDRHATWDGYLTDMEQDGTWGDHVILWAAANCYQIAIHVISSLPGHSEVIIKPDCPFDQSKHLVLGHVHEVHYVSLQPLQGKDQNITHLKIGLSMKFANKIF